MTTTSFAIATAHLRQASTIAVLGAHHEPAKAAFYVPEYLRSRGYRILPVNPRFAGQHLFGATVVGSLAEVSEAVDIVDVFRRAADVPGHVAEILAMRPLPKVVWLQLGIRHEAAAAELEAAGIEVVQDRCTLADHRRAGLPAAGA